MKSKAWTEKVMQGVFFIAACTSVLAVALICIFLFANGIPAIRQIGFVKFITGDIWRPGNELFGIFPMIVGRIIIPSTIDVVRIPFPSPDFSTSPIIFKVLPKSRMIGTTITMPKKPYTTDGIPASSSVAAFNGL